LCPSSLCRGEAVGDGFDVFYRHYKKGRNICYNRTQKRLGRWRYILDDKRFSFTGKYLGVNSQNGVGEHHARIFLQDDKGHTVDGLVTIAQYEKLKKGQVYTLDLTKANDPSPTYRSWV
jgi:hypothetical protein